jgi:hypothetical protein
MSGMVPTWQQIEFPRRAVAARPLARLMLSDRRRLPSRFFGRLTASVQAGL